MNNFIVAVQNQLNFNKMLETQIAQLAATLPHPNGRDFLGQPAIPIKENVRAVITRSWKTMAWWEMYKHPVEEEEKAETEVKAEPRRKKEEENLSKALPKDISDTNLLLFPCQAKKLVEDEKFSRFMEIIWRM
jgi:hypothetical protein